MAKHAPTEHFIQEKADVQDADHAATYALGRGGRLAPAPFDPDSQSLLLMGLPGSGRGPLASALADRLDMMVALLGLEGASPDQPELVAAALAHAMRAMQGPGRVFVLDDRLVPLLDGQALAFLPLTAVYLIADVGTCLQNLLDADDVLRSSLAARLQALEPAAMTLARHIVRADLPLAQQLTQTLEKLQLPVDADCDGMMNADEELDLYEDDGYHD